MKARAREKKKPLTPEQVDRWRRCGFLGRKVRIPLPNWLYPLAVYRRAFKELVLFPDGTWEAR